MSKMNVSWVLAIFMAVLLVACQEEQSADTQGATDASGAAFQKRSSNHPAIVLADGYVPSFRHEIRSQRHVARGAKFRHVVIMEFLETNEASVIRTLRSELTDRGFNFAEPTKRHDRTRLVATKEGLRLVIDISGADTIKVNNPAARGIAYFTWVDNKRR